MAMILSQQFGSLTLKNPSKRHRYPRDIILLAVRWYCRYSLSYRNVRDLIAERGIKVDAATIYRWVQKFGPDIAQRSFKHRSWRGLDWHVDETYLRVNGRWRYLWRAVDQHGQLIDFRLTARRDTAAARAFFRQARDTVRLYQPLSITTDKAPTYYRIIKELNRQRLPGEEIFHCDRKYLNNRIESDHAALKRFLNPKGSFRSLKSAKSTLRAIEAFRTIKRGHINTELNGVRGEIQFVAMLFT
jgi:IS6 family transposase